MSLDERIKYAAMKARHQRILLPWYKKWWGIIILIVIGLFLALVIASGLYVINKIKEIQSAATLTASTQAQQEYLAAIKGDGSNYYLGSDSPRLTIIEFSDFACPFCQESVAGLKNAAASYKDKIKIVFRDYPVHENSIDLALAARCAGEQSKFWEMHDELFANQTELNVSSDGLTEKLVTLAEKLKLNTEQFNTCLTEKRYLEKIKKDFEDGEKLQIEGTPTWFINNNILTGYLPTEKFAELISGLLK
jgi:protein-disulfide isomerase